MSCQILVSNKSGIAKAEIVTIVDGGHKWSAKESMQSFIDSGGAFELWDRAFSVVKVTDKETDELSFLLSRNIEMLPTWSFTEPSRDSQEWQNLYLLGEVERAWSVVSQYLVER